MKKGRHRRFEEARKLKQSGPGAFDLGLGDTGRRTNTATDDEAEIQFRAAIPFYTSQRWTYAAAAFAEVLEIDRDRDDARYFLAACLLLGGSLSDAVPQLEKLLETEYETPARVLLAHALYALGRPAEAREAAAPAAAEDYHAAGWVARYDLLVH